MSAPSSHPSHSAASLTRHGEATAWDWLQAQLAGRAVPAVLTIVGLRDLSLLAALEAHAPGTKVLALEPDASVAREAQARPELDTWRSAGRLVYLAGPGYAGADQAWRIYPARFEQPPLLVHPAVASAAGLRGAVEVLAKIVFGAKANAEARRRFAPRYLLNSIRNLPAILAGRDVRAVAGRGEGAPAIVVGAGPSLDHALDDLKRLGPGAVVIATDTALRPLLLHGIAPQFVVGLDPSDLNARHLLDLPACRHTWLVAESALDPRATAAFHERTLWFRVAPHPPWPWLNQMGIDVGRLEVWGSVLTAAFQVACLAGCDPIVMVGADLSFPDGRPYARRTTYEFDWAWAAALGISVEDTWRQQLASRKDVRLERDLTGGETPTTGVMLEFRDWIVAQARKGRRRVINATGRGLLFGDGVEQGRLTEALAERPPLRPLLDHGARPDAARSAQMVRSLRALGDALASGTLDQQPLPDWRDFSGDGFDLDALRAAVESAASGFSPSRRRQPSPAVDRLDDELGRLPEAVARLRVALRGDADLPAVAGVAPEAQRQTLARAFALLGDIVDAVGRRPDLAGFPDPLRIDDTPAGAIAMWPDDLRRMVLRFEGLLGRAWAGTTDRPRRGDVATVALLPGDRAGTNGDTSMSPRPYASHACLLLVVEWLRCAASISSSLEVSLSGLVDRLWTLERTLRTAEEWARSKADVELVLDAPWTTTAGSSTPLVLPLRISAEAWWALRAGLVFEAQALDAAWLVARVRGDLPTRIWLRPSGAALVPDASEASVRSVVPRRVESAEWPGAKIADQIPAGALCVVPGVPATVLVDASGRIARYQTWPRPITGAVSLGERGEVAWNGALGAKADGPKPYLMWRPRPEAGVEVIELPFRPARGVWWRGRVYMNCLPAASGQGGVGSWAPGEAPVLRWPHLPVQGLLPSAEGLHLEPYIPGETCMVGRTRAAGVGAWTFIPGSASLRRTLGPLGAASASASNGRWTAVAYPQADTITLTAPGGRCHALHCYFPTRITWAGDSLVVYAADPDLFIFDRLGAALDAPLSSGHEAAR